MAAGLSSDVVVGNAILAADLNNLRSDALKLVAVKTADETVNSGGTGSTFQDDDDLLFAIGSSSTEVHLFRLFLIASAHATPDLKLRITVPGSGTLDGIVHHDVNQTVIAEGTSEVFQMTGTGTPEPIIIDFIVKGDGTSGNVQLEWAQNTSSANDTTVHVGSCLLHAKLVA